MIAWEESGSGRPLVLVHGLTEDRRVWDTVVPLLEQRFRCIRLDLRGHGASPDADDYAAAAMAGDVATVVDEADVEEPPLIVGHSLGGVVVTMYAAQAPVRGVVNIDQPLRFGDFATALAPLADMLRGPGFGDAVAIVFDGLGSDGVPDAVGAYLHERHAAARRDVVLGVWSTVLDTPPDELTALAEGLLGAITVPFVEIHGGEPGEGYADWLTTLLPTATVEVWGRGGHYPHLADPERFAARLKSFDAEVG